jgi:hypothetical protein
MRAQKVAFVRPHRRTPAPAVPKDFRKVRRLRYYVPEFKREFDYTALGDILKLRIAAAIAEAHVAYITRFARRTALGSYHAIRSLAETTATNPTLSRALKRCKSLTIGTGAECWRQAVADQVSVLERRPIGVTTYVEEIGNLFRSLDELTSRAIAPTCERPVMPRNYHAAGGHRRGLVEQSSEHPVAPELLAKFEEHIDELNLPLKGEEARDLLRALAAQVPIELLHDEVAVAEAIFRINAKALDDVRRAAEETFLYWRDVWLKGQALLASVDGASIHRAVRKASRLAKNLANAPRRALFSPSLGDEAIGNFLALIHSKHPNYVPAEVERYWPMLMRRAFWDLGGRPFFDGCFALHRAGVAAAVILYLVDAGANVSTALSLTTNSEQETDDPQFVNFVSYKDRAGPEPIIKQLPLKADGVKVTAAQALREVKAMTQTRREMYPELLGDSLFIHTFFREPSVLTVDVLADNFRYMLRDAQLPQVWTPGAIRVAVAVEVSGKTSGDLDRVGRKMSHAIGSSATPIYALRWATRVLLTRKMREYMTLLEAAFSTHAGGPGVLGYSREVADLLFDKAIRTGLGFLCKDANARGGKVTQDGRASCPELGKSCADCQVRVFVTDVESLAEMVAVHDSLDKRLEEYEEARQQVWVENWLDLYAFSSAVIQKAKRSRFAHLMPAARRKAEQMLQAGFDVFLIKE